MRVFREGGDVAVVEAALVGRGRGPDHGSDQGGEGEGSTGVP